MCAAVSRNLFTASFPAQATCRAGVDAFSAMCRASFRIQSGDSMASLSYIWGDFEKGEPKIQTEIMFLFLQRTQQEWRNIRRIPVWPLWVHSRCIGYMYNWLLRDLAARWEPKNGITGTIWLDMSGIYQATGISWACKTYGEAKTIKLCNQPRWGWYRTPSFIYLRSKE